MSDSNDIYHSNDIYDSNDLARDLMMPTGEPAAAVIGACLLLGMIWFAASGHLATRGGAGTVAAHTAAAAPSSLQSSGGPIAPPAAHRSAG
jgi:hypothetical protein